MTQGSQKEKLKWNKKVCQVLASKLSAKIPSNNTNFESYLPNITNSVLYKALKPTKFKNASFALKTNKIPGYDKIHVNVIRKLYQELKLGLMNISSLSLKTGIFPKYVKIDKVSRIFQKGDKSIISNYRPIFVLPCFSKILKSIITRE